MIVGSKNLRTRFLPFKPSNQGAYGEEKAVYRIRFEKALIFSLAAALSVFLVSRRLPERNRKTWKLNTMMTAVAMDVTPRTRQPGSMARPPNLPQVPIPTEDEYLPEDETIELTQLDIFEDIPLFDGVGGGGGGGVYRVPWRPRPIREVIPEYPESERKRGVEGVVVLEILVNQEGYVDSVRVVDNTTRSQRIAHSAVEAAYRSQYVPATRDGRKVPIWIQRPYRFEGK
jgi:TonB family protein